MNKRFIIATFITTAIAYFGGWLIFGIVFKDMYTSNANPAAAPLQRGEPFLPAILIATFAWCVLLTWVLQKTVNTGFISGFSVGFFISFLIMVIFDFNIYAFWNIYQLKFIIKGIFVGTFFWAVISGISGSILAYRKRERYATA